MATAQAGRKEDARIGEILERTNEFYEDVLWRSKIGESTRARLVDAGVEEKTLEAFGVGYAPIGNVELLEHLAQWDYSVRDLETAGIATHSVRKRLHVRFRSRVIFPVRERDGRLVGFAGLATHLAPSWPLWLTSPERGRFRRADVLFGIDAAGPAIAKAGRTVLLPDCLSVLRHHQDGERNAVSVVQSAVTGEHVAILAGELSADAEEIGFERREDDEHGGGRILVAAPRDDLGADALALEDLGAQELAPAPVNPHVFDAVPPPTRLERVATAIGVAVVGVGVPLGWTLIVNPSADSPGGRGVAFVGVGICVAITYVLLTIVVARVAARARETSARRRMRAPYMHGSDESQPVAWTYHRLENLEIAAVLISVAILIGLFLTIGGFTGWNTATALAG
jgi:hypothetical protein